MYPDLSFTILLSLKPPKVSATGTLTLFKECKVFLSGLITYTYFVLRLYPIYYLIN